MAGVDRRISKYGARLFDSLRAWYHRPYPMRLPIARLLLGGENAVSAAHFARLTGDVMRPSTPVSKSPQLMLLQEYERRGAALLDAAELCKTPYFENAMKCVEIFGRYFYARDEGGVLEFAREYIARYEGRPAMGPPRLGQSAPGKPIRVRPVIASECYEVIDGHHRIAIAKMGGKEYLTVQVEGPAARTPLQSLVLDAQLHGGRWELSQPIDAPELRGWRLKRDCPALLDAMLSFLAGEGLVPARGAGFLDVGSRYGWFVERMSALGFDARGVERNPAARAVGLAAYRLSPERIALADCVRYLRSGTAVHAVVSCLGVLHSYFRGEGSVSADEFVRLLDTITDKVLFIGMEVDAAGRGGQGPSELEDWLRRNTTFSRIERLDVDREESSEADALRGYTLMACVH